MAKCDIDAFFDSIPHALLFERIGVYVKEDKLVALLEVCLKMGQVNPHNAWTDQTQGLPQGAVLSPLLANMYLHPLDEWAARQSIGYVRYADDFLFLCISEKQAKTVLNQAGNFIQNKLGLVLDTETRACKASDGFDYLGLHFQGATVTVSAEKRQELKDKISSNLSIVEQGLSTQMTETLQGIRQYYGLLLAQTELEGLDLFPKEQLVTYIRRRQELFPNQRSILRGIASLTFFSKAFMVRRQQCLRDIARLGMQRKTIVDQKPAEAVTQKLLQRKREYQDREAEGFEVVLTRSGLFVGINQRGIVVKEKGVNLTQTPSENVRHISVLTEGITLSSNLIQHCARKGISITFFGRDGKPYAKLASDYDTSASLWQRQADLDEQPERIAYLIRQVIGAKLKNQRYLLKYFLKYRHKRTDTSTLESIQQRLAQMKLLHNTLKKLTINQNLAEFRQQAMVLEAQTAQLYWELFGWLVINEDVSFPGREQQGATDPINSMLNYGYGILYGRVWDAILKARLNPFISFFHAFQEGKPTLVYDLVEEFRQAVIDRPIVAMLTQQGPAKLENGRLVSESRQDLIKRIFERLNSPELFRGEYIRLGDVLQNQVFALRRYINGETDIYKYIFRQ